MGPTATSVELPGSEMGSFVADNFEENLDRRCGKIHGQANNAAFEMYPTQRAAKASVPLDPHGLLKASDAPAVSAVL